MRALTLKFQNLSLTGFIYFAIEKCNCASIDSTLNEFFWFAASSPAFGWILFSRFRESSFAHFRVTRCSRAPHELLSIGGKNTDKSFIQPSYKYKINWVVSRVLRVSNCPWFCFPIYWARSKGKLPDKRMTRINSIIRRSKRSQKTESESFETRTLFRKYRNYWQYKALTEYLQLYSTRNRGPDKFNKRSKKVEKWWRREMEFFPPAHLEGRGRKRNDKA